MAPAKTAVVMDTTAPATTNKLLLVLIAFLLPPVAVGLERGFGRDFVINVILTIFFWLPGFIHALTVIL